MLRRALGDNPLAPSANQGAPDKDAAALPWLARHSFAGASVREISINLIDPNPEQPRKQFDEAGLEDFARSIKDRGILQPVTVRPAQDGRYVLLMGERRWRAAKMAGLQSIPALMRADGDSLELALIENIQREDLKPVDMAEALRVLKSKHGYTDEVLAKVVGKSRSWVTNTLVIVKLPEAALQVAKQEPGVGRDALIEIAREKNPQKAQALLDGVVKGESKSKDLRSLRERLARRYQRHYRFRYAPKPEGPVLTIVFDRPNVSNEEIKKFLKQALISLDSKEA
ncbi:MAG: ParB/RepB/Spo0J family partition protein [Elusimicrobia bacterium]|nr:ParB/RepB/Spo0J family partition protein [Elusimicrobiota bacterium]